jgi:Flp pilus assembly protein TadG
LLSGSERGSQLVEFAFVAPILLVLLTGMASFAMALYKYQQLGYATSTAAQGVGDQYGLLADPCAQIVTDVTASLPSPAWTAGNFTYTLYITDKSNVSHQYGPTTGSGFSCTPATTVWAQNYPMTIQVSYAYNWFPIMNWTRWGSTNTFVPTGSLSVSESVLVQ